MPKPPLFKILKQIKELYIALENTSDEDFKQAANLSVWPECLIEMRLTGKNLVEILQQTAPLELLAVVEKYNKTELGDKS